MFWTNYIDLCNSIGKAPTAVAVEIGFSNAAATGWKSGAMPRPAGLKKIADYFGVTVEKLLENKKEPATNGDGLPPEVSEIMSLLETASAEKRKLVLGLLKLP